MEARGEEQRTEDRSQKWCKTEQGGVIKRKGGVRTKERALGP